MRACFCSALHTPQYGLLRDDGGDAAGVLRGQAGRRGGETADGGQLVLGQRLGRAAQLQQAADGAAAEDIACARRVDRQDARRGDVYKRQSS